MFKEFAKNPDYPETERRILRFWEENGTFEKLRAKRRGGPRFSFIDGPITANNPMGIHHAWGRAYKDIFQRFRAMQGYELRYQNGFDCQGLWVEVEVEKELGFTSKRDIETYGIDRFVERCKERCAQIRRGANATIHPPGLLDGLEKFILHHVGREQLHHLDVPQAMPRSRVDLQGTRRHAVVPTLRNCRLRHGNRDRGISRTDAQERLFTPAAEGSTGCLSSDVDDNAMDAARQCRGGGKSRTDLRENRSGGAFGHTCGDVFDPLRVRTSRDHREDVWSAIGRPFLLRSVR